MKPLNLFKVICLVLAFSICFSPAYAITYTYDNLGRLAAADYGNQTVDFNYDAGGNLLKINAPPVVKTTNPITGSTGVSLDKTIAITFSEAIQPSTTFAGISITTGTANISYTSEISGNILYLNPVSNFEFSSTYNVSLPKGSVRDLSGKEISADYNFNFTSEADSVAPTVYSTDPSNGLTDVPLDKLITVTFNEDVETGINISQTSIKTGETVVNFTYAVTGKTLILDPVNNLNYSSIYTVSLPTGAVKDLAGNQLSGNYGFNFTTISPSDTTGPSITAAPATNDASNSADISVLISATDDSGVSNLETVVTSTTTQPASGYTSVTNPYNQLITQTGTWYIHARATDINGNLTYQMFGPYHKFTGGDTTGPTITATPSSNDSTNTGHIYVTVQVSDPSGVSKVESQVTPYITEPTTGYTLVGTSFQVTIKSDGIWYLHVRATDSMGNKTYNRFGPYYKNAWDLQGPTITADPSNNNNTNTADISVNISASDNAGVATVETVVSDTAVQPTSGYSPVTNPYTQIITQIGTWYIHVRAMDVHGNVTKQTFGPYYKVTDAPDTDGPSITATPSTNDPANTADISVNVSASDLSGISTFETVVTDSSAQPTSGYIARTTPYTETITSEGTWYIHVKASDSRGNISYQVFGPYYKVAPSSTISANPTTNSPTNKFMVDILVSASDPDGISKVEVLVNNSTSQPTSGYQLAPGTAFTITIKSSGTWYLHVKVTDTKGNVSYKMFGPYYKL